MKKFVFLFLAALFFTACSAPVAVQQQNQANSNQTQPPRRPSEQTAVSHSTENQFPPTKMPGNDNSAASPGSGNSPMARAIDVSAMTASIDRLEKMYKKAPGDLEAKTALADAYFNRASAL